MTENAETACGYTTKIFRTLKEFVDENSGFENLVLSNFQAIFLYYFSICSLVLGAFLLDHLVRFVRKRRLFWSIPCRN